MEINYRHHSTGQIYDSILIMLRDCNGYELASEEILIESIDLESENRKEKILEEVDSWLLSNGYSPSDDIADYIEN